MNLDWIDLWERLRRMLWATAVLGAAGLTAGLWIYGITLGSWHRGMPGAYADLLQPTALQEAVRVVVGWLRTWELPALVLWLAALVWTYLVPDLGGRVRLRATVLGVLGLVLAAFADRIPGWGEADQFVRLGVLLGAGCYLGIGLGSGLRGRPLARRVLEGAVTGGVVGLLSVFAVEASVLGLLAGLNPEAPLLGAPIIWGAVVGWTVTGGRECLRGPQSLGAALRARWPLLAAVAIVLINAVGPVLLTQHLSLAIG